MRTEHPEHRCGVGTEARLSYTLVSWHSQQGAPGSDPERLGQSTEEVAQSGAEPWHLAAFLVAAVGRDATLVLKSGLSEGEGDYVTLEK